MRTSFTPIPASVNPTFSFLPALFQFLSLHALHRKELRKPLCSRPLQLFVAKRWSTRLRTSPSVSKPGNGLPLRPASHDAAQLPCRHLSSETANPVREVQDTELSANQITSPRKQT